MIKKFFKIFEIRRQEVRGYLTQESILVEPWFAPADINTSKELCEQAVESMRIPGAYYAIVEVWEREYQ